MLRYRIQVMKVIKTRLRITNQLNQQPCQILNTLWIAVSTLVDHTNIKKLQNSYLTLGLHFYFRQSDQQNHSIPQASRSNLASEHCIYLFTIQYLKQMKRPHTNNPYEDLPSKRPLLNSQQIDRSSNPLFIIERKVYLYTLSPLYKEAYNILVQISLAESRPTYMHQYSINEQSILKAITLGYSNKDILNFLAKYMRNDQIPKQLEQFINNTTMKYAGSARMYLEQEDHGNYFYLSLQERAYKSLSLGDHFNDYIIQKKQEDGAVVCRIETYRENKIAETLFKKGIPFHFQYSYKRKVEVAQNRQRYRNIYEMTIKEGRYGLKDLKIQLKTFTKLRNYQQAALKSIFFTGDRKSGGEMRKQDIAKSGVIVLPCGAGKTLLGISVACKIKKQTLIICSGEVGVDQWKRQILKWTSEIQPHQIVTLTSKTQKNYKYNVKKSDPVLVISSYPFLSAKLIKKQQGYAEFEWVRRLPWGLVLLDEVQWLPAQSYFPILDNLQTHMRIGLTATLYRQDDKIGALDYVIGPLLYEGNWRDFVDLGYLANPYCIQVRVDLTPHFKSQYFASQQAKQTKQMIYFANPNKIKALIYLLQIHQSRKDQIIIFCDSVPLIRFVAKKLKIPAVYGQIPTQDRNFVFQMFRRGRFKTLLLSRTGDQAIDLPNANVAIELTFNKGSRKQVLQRLGRIMRQKQNPTLQYNAFFYTMISEGTNQRVHFSKRHKTLVDLGFQYDIINQKDLQYHRPNSQYAKVVHRQQIKNQQQYLNSLLRDGGGRQQ